jgi:hypothetical protein
VKRSDEKGLSLDSRLPFSSQGDLLTTGTLVLTPLALYHPKRARWPRGVTRSIMRVQ